MNANDLAPLGLAAGAAVASGVRVYATVAALGLLERLGVIHLPLGLEVLGHPAVIALASVLYIAEFIADKIPAFDSVWDAVHTFVRVPAAAVLAFAVLGEVAEPWRTGAALVCGTLALSAHGLKSGARLAVNASPEPFSNWALSFGEEFAVAALLWAAVAHPWLALGIAAAVLLAGVLAVRWIIRVLRRLPGVRSRRRAEALRGSAASPVGTRL
jgi:hypothetical protein